MFSHTTWKHPMFLEGPNLRWEKSEIENFSILKFCILKSVYWFWYEIIKLSACYYSQNTINWKLMGFFSYSEKRCSMFYKLLIITSRGQTQLSDFPFLYREITRKIHPKAWTKLMKHFIWCPQHEKYCTRTKNEMSSFRVSIDLGFASDQQTRLLIFPSLWHAYTTSRFSILLIPRVVLSHFWR